MDEEIASIAERELGKPPDGVSRVAEGLLHETYELDLDGREYVLQFSSDADEDRRDDLRRGLGCYVMLRNCEIPVPEVVTETARASDGRRYVLVEKVPGETGKRDVSPERVRNAGRYLAKIHECRSFDDAGWIRFDDRGASVHEFRNGSSKGRIRRTVEENANALQEAGMKAVGRELEGVLDRLNANLPDDFRPVLCHGDYSPDNVLFRGDEVTGILDFDRAYSGHDQRDLVSAANSFWMHDPCSDWNVRATFYEGYREVSALERSFERNEPLYRVETLVDAVAGLLALDELSEYEREFYAERILETIDRAQGA